jgi:hypothetical protein
MEKEAEITPIHTHKFIYRNKVHKFVGGSAR